MAEAITKENLFQFARRVPQTMTDITNDAVRAVMKAEADSREAKSQRLRLARLEMEARQPIPPAKRRVRNTPKHTA